MNIEPDIFDYLETTSLEPHEDYTSEITYKDQKIIWKRLKEQDKEIERLKARIDKATGIANERINYCYHENDKEQLESWDEVFDVLQGIDENE